LESGVVRGEDGKVRGGVDGFGELGCVDGSEESAEAGFLSDSADVRWESEETVDDMDDSTVEGDILVVSSVYVRIASNRSESTHSFSDRDVIFEPRDYNDLSVAHAAFDDLTASDIGKGSIVEQCGGEGRSFSNVF
jgi:hypothetical protein